MQILLLCAINLLPSNAILKKTLSSVVSRVVAIAVCFRWTILYIIQVRILGLKMTVVEAILKDELVRGTILKNKKTYL